MTPQLMLPLVGDLAPAHRRATSLSLVVSGLSLGMLIARLLSGVIANFTDWRNIYWFAFGAQWCIFALLFFFMPDYPSKNPGGLNWFQMMWSIIHMLFTEPLLVQACLINFIMSSIFTSFWTTLSFLLSSPPYNYSSLTIGLFALIGIFIICWGPVYSRLIIDKIQPLYSCLLGISVEITGVAIGTSIGTHSCWSCHRGRGYRPGQPSMQYRKPDCYQWYQTGGKQPGQHVLHASRFHGAADWYGCGKPVICQSGMEGKR